MRVMIHDALALLGDEPAEMAKTLQDAGYHGHPHTGTRCPIANYLKDMLKGDFHVAYGMVLLDDFRAIDLPCEVSSFIVQFDAGRFPELMAAPAKDMIWVD